MASDLGSDVTRLWRFHPLEVAQVADNLPRNMLYCPIMTYKFYLGILAFLTFSTVAAIRADETVTDHLFFFPSISVAQQNESYELQFKLYYDAPQFDQCTITEDTSFKPPWYDAFLARYRPDQFEEFDDYAKYFQPYVDGNFSTDEMRAHYVERKVEVPRILRNLQEEPALVQSIYGRASVTHEAVIRTPGSDNHYLVVAFVYADKDIIPENIHSSSAMTFDVYLWDNEAQRYRMFYPDSDGIANHEIVQARNLENILQVYQEYMPAVFMKLFNIARARK